MSKRDEKWARLEEEFLSDLRKARQAGLVADSFDEIESVVEEAGKKLQRKLMAVMAEQREAEGGQHCPTCGEDMQRRGKVKRRLQTGQGSVNFERERWVCPKCGANLFPPG
jgi:transposase-like protein